MSISQTSLFYRPVVSDFSRTLQTLPAAASSAIELQSMLTTVTTVSFLSFLCFTPILLLLYIRHNDKKITRLPKELESIAARPFTPEILHTAATKLIGNPISVEGALPPKTGRRYIVVGGSGFLGGWIVVHLLQRGEDPKRIRIVDLRPPSRQELKQALLKGVDFAPADITDASSVHSAFNKPWQVTESPEPEITVFTTAAAIRFYERHASLVPFSANVNVLGTQNIIDAARACGASILCATSSGSVGVKNTRFLLAPWEKEPDYFVQVIRDELELSFNPHNSYFSNYAYTKLQGEQLVHSADLSCGANNTTLRTGCIRPSNGIYGTHGDTLCEMYMKRKGSPTWIAATVQNFIYVENCSLAHLCYEQRLLETINGSKNPDIGGQSFIVSDAGPPISYGDVYTSLNVLTDGEMVFPVLSSTGMLILSHIVECYYVTTLKLRNSNYLPLRALGHLWPQMRGDIVNLQPSLWSLVNVHLYFDDSRARAAPEDGGLGYNPPWSSLAGMCHVVSEFKAHGGLAEDIHLNGGGSSAASGLVKAEIGVKQVLERIEELGAVSDN